MSPYYFNMIIVIILSIVIRDIVGFPPFFHFSTSVAFHFIYECEMIERDPRTYDTEPIIQRVKNIIYRRDANLDDL